MGSTPKGRVEDIRTRNEKLKDFMKDSIIQQDIDYLLEINADLLAALKAVLPLAENGGQFGNVCNGCQRNTYEFGQHSDQCPVKLGRAAIKSAERSK